MCDPNSLGELKGLREEPIGRSDTQIRSTVCMLSWTARRGMRVSYGWGGMREGEEQFGMLTHSG